jgi:hypothetical protein
MELEDKSRKELQRGDEYEEWRREKRRKWVDKEI